LVFYFGQSIYHCCFSSINTGFFVIFFLGEKMESFLLAGDIGGTKTTLAIIDPIKGPRSFIVKETLPSSNYLTFDALLDVFLKQNNYPLSRGCFGIAGPVFEGSVQMPNNPWLIEESTLSNKLKIPFHLINDLEAIANSVPILEKDDLESLSVGNATNHGSLVVIAPGTGLGEAHLHWNETCYQSYPSEGGHVDFAPTNQMQFDLLIFLQDRIGHVSYERVCSGPGLLNIYAFFKESSKYPEPEWLSDQISKADNPTPIISQAALEGKAEIAVATLDLFVSILGSEAGNLALKELATGGVYIGGGIPPRIIPFLKKELFMDSFKNKGRFSSMLANIPVYVITNPDAALMGAAHQGLK
jgi:glucokinase